MAWIQRLQQGWVGLVECDRADARGAASMRRPGDRVQRRSSRPLT